MTLVQAFLEILKRPSIWAIVLGLIQFLGPVWIAFLLGVVVGWAWKPRRASVGNCKFDISAPSSPSALILAPAEKSFGSIQNVDSSRTRSCEVGKEDLGVSGLITCEDLEHLCRLSERKDGGLLWKHMMDRSTHTMSYQAWQRDHEDGPPQYCSRTIYEDASPELLRDFFWDDEFRLEWDDMLTNASILEECPQTGIMLVHWTRKFPFFCSDREYIIGRRIWKSERSYYCVTKGVPCSYVPRRNKPRRVDIFYSSWLIQLVESRNGYGEMSAACEVLLFHHEDMGIPREIAKFGIRQGMWGAVKNIERGFRAYQKHRSSGPPPSRHAFLAGINTKLDPHYLKSLLEEDGKKDLPAAKLVVESGEVKSKGTNISKLLIIGGAIAVACSLDRGFLTKTLVFGIARKFGNIGRRGVVGPT